MTLDDRYMEEPAAPPRPLSLDKIVERASKLKTRFVDLGALEGYEPGEGVWVRELTARERSLAMKMMGEFRTTDAGDTVIDTGKIDPDGDIKLVWWATLESDDMGNPVPGSQMFDARKLNAQPTAVIREFGSGFIDAVVKAIRELSGLGKDAKEKQKKD